MEVIDTIDKSFAIKMAAMFSAMEKERPSQQKHYMCVAGDGIIRQNASIVISRLPTQEILVAVTTVNPNTGDVCVHDFLCQIEMVEAVSESLTGSDPITISSILKDPSDPATHSS